MSIRVLRKALGLLIVDIVIIIGIFVLQFRTDSSFIEKIEDLQLTLTRLDEVDNPGKLKNKLNVSYNGLNLFCDDQHPAVIMTSNAQTLPVELIGWERTDELSIKLIFTDDVSISLELASNEPNASLAIISELPANITNFAIPYNYSSNMRPEKDDGNRVILNGRKNVWEVYADSLSSGYFGLSSHNYIATYGVYDETQKFTFESIIDLDIADASVFARNVENFKNNLIAAFKSNNSDANLSEQIIVSYIAAQAENGNYASAIEEIPANLKKSKQRTYLSAPYLNSLEDMNATLDKALKDYEKKINEAANNNSLDIFTVPNIANFMYIHSNVDNVKKLLQSTAYIDETKISIAQATGIINVYTDLYDLNVEYANYLLSAVMKCIDKISNSCSFEGNILTISDNDTFLSVIQAVETGIALHRYGELCGDVTLQKAGYVLVNSYMSESSSFDLRTLSNLYPILAYNNWYYPHFKKIATESNNIIWAWTSAKSITLDKTDSNNSSLIIDFPEGLTHYVIVKGIRSFKTIYIYNMAFRTDPRFETYNSSGYVYKQNAQTLLLKSRHKTQKEVIGFDFSATEKKPEAAKPAETAKPAPAPETSVAAPVTETPAEETSVESAAVTEPEVAAPATEEVQPAATETVDETSAEETVVEDKKSKKKKK